MDRKSTFNRTTLLLVAGAFVVGTTGCASWTSSKPAKKNSMWSSMQFWKKPYQRPQKIVAIWSPDILTMTGKPPTRGFGGRLYFYNEKSQAIPVNGELIVHGYLEKRIGKKIQLDKIEADKTFVFTAEQFTEHFSPSELGASYSIWIPWDAAGGEQLEITLIPAFKGEKGDIVQGEAAKLILPGKRQGEMEAVPFQQVSYQKAHIPTNTGPLTPLATTTISVPAKINRADDASAFSVENIQSGPVMVGAGSSGSQAAGDATMIYGGAAGSRSLVLTPGMQAPVNYGVGANGYQINYPVSYPVAPTTGMTQPSNYPSLPNATPVQGNPQFQNLPSVPTQWMAPHQINNGQSMPNQFAPIGSFQQPNFSQPGNMVVSAVPNATGNPMNTNYGPAYPSQPGLGFSSPVQTVGYNHPQQNVHPQQTGIVQQSTLQTQIMPNAMGQGQFQVPAAHQFPSR